VLEAAIELASRAGRRLVPMGQFIDRYRHTQCRSDEIVTALVIPKPGGQPRGHFLKLGARAYLVISIAMVAGVLAIGQDRRLSQVRLAVGACSAVPQRLTELEAALIGERPASAAEVVSAAHFEGLSPIDDIRGSAAYRRAAALTLTRDLLNDLAAGVTRRAA
jgi:CO/xanthine dehydrogenase FAD-binding subunit